MLSKYKSILYAIGGTLLVVGIVIYFASKNAKIQSIIIGHSNIEVDSLSYNNRLLHKRNDSLQLVIGINNYKLTTTKYKPIYIDVNKLRTNEAAIIKAIQGDTINPSRDVKFWKDYFSN